MNRLSLQGPVRRPRLGARTTLAAAALAVALGSFAALSVRGAPGEDILGERRGQIRALEGEIQRIDALAGEAADAHAAAVARAESLRLRLADTRQGLVEARRAREVALERLSNRIVGLYAQEPMSLVEIVLTSGGLAAAVDAQAALEAVSAEDRRIVDQISDTRERLTRLESRLEGDRRAVDENVSESAARLRELQSLIVDRRAALDDARGALDALVARDRRLRAQRATPAAAAGDAAAERALLRRAEPATATVEPPAAATGAQGDVSAALQRIALCESGGNPRAVSASGQYRGKYQFDPATWRGLGGTGDPAAAPEAEQDRIAALLYSRSGPSPWPVCGYR